MNAPVVIVGTGLAGYNLAREFRKLDGETPLLLITADDGRSYSKPMLSTGFGKNKDADGLSMAEPGTMASQLSDLTGGEDGRTFKVPELLQPGFHLIEGEIFGRAVDGKLITYYLVFFAALALFLFMLRIVNSPFGRVLQAIRENDFRAEALGYRTVVYRTLANCLGALIATLAGVLMALWLRYVGPKTMLSFEVMTDILLIVVIGGMGTIYGAVIGSALFILMQNYLQVLMKEATTAMAGLPFLANLFHPDRWLLWLGVLFVLSVYFFPTGIVGRLRAGALARSRPRP